ncbi:MAG: TIGR00270 family protein [Euryarchaeota archaeon]|nr:TIGR00270 family protein [Euryarchaeota archaeon]
MCGKDLPTTKATMVEGTKLMLCPNCAKFGDDAKSASRPGAPVHTKAVIEQRLQRRERRMQTRDVYTSAGTVELVEDYGTVIREAREKRGMDLEQYASSISEKKGTLAKIEANNLVPDDKLRAKIEKSLDVRLTEVVSAAAAVGGGRGNGAMTLGSFIKKE